MIVLDNCRIPRLTFVGISAVAFVFFGWYAAAISPNSRASGWGTVPAAGLLLIAVSAFVMRSYGKIVLLDEKSGWIVVLPNAKDFSRALSLKIDPDTKLQITPIKGTLNKPNSVHLYVGGLRIPLGIFPKNDKSIEKATVALEKLKERFELGDL